MALNFKGPASTLVKDPKLLPRLQRVLPPELINVLRTSNKQINVKLNNQPVGVVATELKRQLGLPAK